MRDPFSFTSLARTLGPFSLRIGITHNTAKAWISILEASYIIFLLQPHYKNFNKRLIKTPKVYFYDTGLACWLLSIPDETQLHTHAMRGSLSESWVISEFVKRRYNQVVLPTYAYFWRDQHGDEIDLLLENGEQLIPCEIKSGKTINADFFKGLQKWKELAGSVGETPTLVYGGEESMSHSGIRVASWRTGFTK